MAGAPAEAAPRGRGGPGWALLPGLLAPGEVAALRQESDGLLAAAALEREGEGEGAPGGGSGWGWVSRDFGCVFQVAPGAPAGEEGAAGAEAYFRWRAAWSHTLGAAGACVANPRVLRALRDAIPSPAAKGGGDPLFLVNEQHLVKPPAEGGAGVASAAGAFPLHRDEDWLVGRRVGGTPYYSLWVALDPMGAENGGLELPAGPKDRLALVPCAAGDAVLMDSRVLHCSGPNRSGAFRRAYMPQFSLGAPLLDLDTGRPVALAVPL